MLRLFPVFPPLLSLLISVTASLAEPAGLAIKGRILEKETNKPLKGMTVFLDGHEDLVAMTERDGSFMLPVDAIGEYSLLAIGPGYERSKPQSVSVGLSDEEETIVVYLMPVYTLTEVVVEGARNLDKTSKTVISGKELMSVAGGAGDPLRAMQALPGITTANDASSNPAIRGSGPENNFYYIDFMPVGYLFHMGGLVSVVNADLVQDFNIYSSAFGPEFFDVTGGLIDVRLRDPRQDRVGGKVNISLLEADALIEGPIARNQSFYLGARRSYMDLVLSRLPEEEGVKITQFPQYYDYQGKYIWKLSDDHTLMFHMSGANDQMKLTLTGDSKEVKKDPVLAGDYSFNLSYNTPVVVLNSKLSPSVNNTFGLSYLDTLGRFQLGQVGYVNIDQDYVFARNHLNIAASERHDLLVGLDYGFATVNIDFDILDAIPSDMTQNQPWSEAPRVQYHEKFNGYFWGFSLKDRWRIFDPLTLVIGQRATYDEYLDIAKVGPRLGAEYSLTKNTLLTAGWGKYHEYPQGYQMVEQLGNRNIGYLQADHYVLGVEQKIEEGWSVKLEGYFKDLYKLPVPEETLNYVNAGSGRAYGAELLIKKNRTANWWGWISAAWSKTERHNELTGERFPYPYDQPYIINIVYNWKISPKWTFGARWRYQSGAPFTPIEKGDLTTYTDASGQDHTYYLPLYGPLGSERLPDYHRLDLRISAEVWSGLQKVEVFAEVINAYNQKNVSGYDYNDDYSSREPVEQLPILPSIGVRAEF